MKDQTKVESKINNIRSRNLTYTISIYLQIFNLNTFASGFLFLNKLYLTIVFWIEISRRNIAIFIKLKVQNFIVLFF